MTITGITCNECGKITYPVRTYCPRCQSTNVKQMGLPVEGEIFTYTRVHFPLKDYPDAPYTVAVVTLADDTIHVTARIEGLEEGQEINIGQKVSLEEKTFPESGDLPLLSAKLV